MDKGDIVHHPVIDILWILQFYKSSVVTSIVLCEVLFSDLNGLVVELSLFFWTTSSVKFTRIVLYWLSIYRSYFWLTKKYLEIHCDCLKLIRITLAPPFFLNIADIFEKTSTCLLHRLYSILLISSKFLLHHPVKLNSFL